MQVSKKLLFLILFFAGCCAYQVNAGNIDPNVDGHQYAWSENAGWFNFNPVVGPGVTVTHSQVTGMAWAENIGWISLDSDYSQISNNGYGKLTGYAWSENSGWISFSCENTSVCDSVDYGVFIDTLTGKFYGKAWAENIGWIVFDYNGADVNGVQTEWTTCIDPNDEDTDDDGIPDLVEDADQDGLLDTDETDPCEPDSDGDGIQDGTELGYTLLDIGPDTDRNIFIPDENSQTTTNPLASDSDNDGYLDGQEDLNKNGKIDDGECDPNLSSSIPIPDVTTSDITSITASEATCGGNVRFDRGIAVTARGVCYAVAKTPDLSDNITSDGIGTGNYVSNITYLKAGETYHVRAYATNSAGTDYGEVKTFVTASPVVSFTSAEQSVLEDMGSTTIEIQLSTVSVLDVTVPFTISGSATQGENFDFTISTSPVTISAGLTTAVITIEILDDTISELEETLIVTMGSPTNASMGDMTVHRITIQDNDPMADISIHKSVNTIRPDVGDQIIYKIVITNNGPNSGTDIEVREVLPSGLLYQSHTLTQGSYGPYSGIWRAGNLLNGASAELYLITNVTEPRRIENTVKIISSYPVDLIGTNNSSSAVINSSGIMGLPWLMLILTN